MPRSAAKRAFGWLVVLAMLALIVPPFINVSRYKGRITSAPGNALGHTVSAGRISLRILPQPGFNMENVEIADNPPSARD